MTNASTSANLTIAKLPNLGLKRDFGSRTSLACEDRKYSGMLKTK
jgi:hypothetical protein